MANSSPEGIELGKGSKLLSMELSINKEKVLSIKKEERSYSEEEVLQLLNNLRLDSYNHGMGKIEFLEWFEQFKKK